MMRVFLFVTLFGMSACSQDTASQSNIEPLPSVLVQEDHVHDWTMISPKGEYAILADRAYVGTHEVGEGSYPKVLTRVYGGESTDSAYFADSILGIDCVTSRIAPIDAFFADKEGGEGERAHYAGEFRQVDGMIANTRDSIFSHVCGPNWSYKFPR